MITSKDNEKLKQVRKLQSRRERQKSGLFVAEGEDVVNGALMEGIPAEFLLVAGEDLEIVELLPHSGNKSTIPVEPALLDSVSALGSGTRVIGVYKQRWSEPGGDLSIYLHAVGDPGNVGTVIRAAHALADGPVILGPGCADPYGPKAVRASMGSIFAKPPVKAGPLDLPGSLVALDARADAGLADLNPEPPVTVCVGAEREGLPQDLLDRADAVARIPIRAGGPDSLNAAMAATVALYELANRIVHGG